MPGWIHLAASDERRVYVVALRLSDDGNVVYCNTPVALGDGTRRPQWLPAGVLLVKSPDGALRYEFLRAGHWVGVRAEDGRPTAAEEDAAESDADH